MTRRSHLQGFLEDLKCRFRGVEPYRCINCDTRFMARPEKPEEKPESK
jgi:hypothetical protein